ncbi:MAG: glycoside hydrolase family 27 protein [Bacteroidales bacterium]|nr:glycoside hydrolase family 27 protein [Bacteroidales bacterium]
MKIKLLIILLLLLSASSCKENSPTIGLEAKVITSNVDIALTPPMGWNSYNCYGAAVIEKEMMENAKMMSVHLKEYGWQYVVVDYCWFYPFPGAMNNPPQTRDFKPGLTMDGNGRLFPSVERFPSSAGDMGFKPLADYIHGLGLKFGIHVMRGVPREAVTKKLPVLGTNVTTDMIANTSDTCNWLNSMYGIDMTKEGAQEYYNSLFELYASWGVDYVKVDDIASPYHAAEIEAVRKAIDKCGRPMVLSLSPGDDMPSAEAEHVKKYANMWRISADFWDDWESLKKQFELCNKWSHVSGPGHWPDADMLPLGILNRRGPHYGLERLTNFTKEEQKTMMTLWSIFRSPLMMGGDLITFDNYTRSLLTNREVIQVNQNSENNRQLFRDGGKIAWIADVPGSQEKYLALFYTGDLNASKISVKLNDMGFNTPCSVRDLWRNSVTGTVEKVIKVFLPAHGSALYKISPQYE